MMTNKNNVKNLLLGALLAGTAVTVAAQTDTSITSISPKGTDEQGRFFRVDKMTSTAAVSAVSGDALYHTPTPNLTNTLYGRLAGLTVIQGLGEPSNNDANLGIRGVGTYGFGGSGTGGFYAFKIFVDGFETNRNYIRGLAAEEIESVSILKDAAALTMFGMRGANGILWITTKRGKVGKPTVHIQSRTGLQSPIKINKPLNSYEYANLYNQAASNDNKMVWTPRYTDAQLQAYQNGTGINTDFYDQVLKKNGMYTDADISFNGGDETARYNVALDYANQNGLFNTKNTDSTSNETLSRYNIRINLDFNMFKIFEARVDIGGRIEDYRQPNYSVSQLFSDIARYPNNIYRIKDSATNWSGTSLYPNNPAASINALGWQSVHNRILQGNFGLKEKLDFITPGLYLNEVYSFNSYTSGGYNKTATYARFSNGIKTTTDQASALKATAQSTLGQEDWKQGMITAGYERTFGDNAILSAINFHQSDYRGEGFYGFAYHYQNMSGRVHYAYKNKYIGEIGFSYFGSDAYAPGHRWGFYPAISAAWVVSNEDFFGKSKIVSDLKIRASVGKTGSSDVDDNPVSGLNGRYLYQQYYQSGSLTGGTFYTGNGTPAQQGVLNPLYIANPDIFAEQAIKYNIGADVSLFSNLMLSLDVFMDKRSGIVTRDNTIPGYFGVNQRFVNLGKQTSRGFEVTATYSNKVGKLGYSVMGLAAYNNNKIDFMGEVPPANTFSAMTGRAYGTRIGLVADGFYQLTDFNTDGSLKSGQPVPEFGAVQAGDIKYKDLDGNGRINQTDVTEIGKPGYPQWTYSFGGNVNYSGLDFGIFLQGIAGATVDILNSAPLQTQAFVNNGNVYSIAKGAWAYYPAQGIDTRATATYPRLSTGANNNNYRTSSFWIKNRDFLRIRNIELGYTISSAALTRAHINKLRIYVNAVNPVTWSSLLKNYQMDPEVLSGYPALKSYNAGFSLIF